MCNDSHYKDKPGLICNVCSPWLRPHSAMHRKQAKLMPPHEVSIQFAITDYQLLKYLAFLFMGNNGCMSKCERISQPGLLMALLIMIQYYTQSQDCKFRAQHSQQTVMPGDVMGKLHQSRQTFLVSSYWFPNRGRSIFPDAVKFIHK